MAFDPDSIHAQLAALAPAIERFIGDRLPRGVVRESNLPCPSWSVMRITRKLTIVDLLLLPIVQDEWVIGRELV